MNGPEAFLNSYGLPAIAAVLLIKSIGVPIPIPADVLMFLAAARVADGTFVLWQTFCVLLFAIIIGDVIQFLLARGPGRKFVYRFGRYLGLTATRLDAASALVKKSNPIGLGLILLTPGVRAASVVACGLGGVALRTFVLGLILGEGVFLALHFFLGSILGTLWEQLTHHLSGPVVVALLMGLLLMGFGAWIMIRRRQRPAASRNEILGDAFEAFHEATCPVCLTLGAAKRLNPTIEVVLRTQAEA